MKNFWIGNELGLFLLIPLLPIILPLAVIVIPLIVIFGGKNNKNNNFHL